MIRPALMLTALLTAALPAAAEEIGCATTAWKLVGANHRVCIYAYDDPAIPGVTCHVSQARTGGIKGSFGLAEDPSQFSLACRQIGPIRFKAKASQGEDMFRQRRSLFFKKMQIVRGCDAKRNVLVYLSYTDRLIEGSPQNSTSTVPVMPWGSEAAPKCGDFLNP